MLKNKLSFFTVFLLLSGVVSGCTMSVSQDSQNSNKDYTSEFPNISTDANDPNVTITMEEQHEFIQKFLNVYTPKVGNAVSITPDSAIIITSGATIKTENRGTLDVPNLVLEIYNPNALNKEISTLQNSRSARVSFIITSSSTATFKMEGIAKNGQIFEKEMTLELKNNKFYLDNVDLTKTIPAVTMEGLDARGNLDSPLSGTIEIQSRANGEFRATTEHGDSIRIYWSYFETTMVNGIEEIFVKQTDLHYKAYYKGSASTDPISLDIYLRFPLGDDRILKANNGIGYIQAVIFKKSMKATGFWKQL